MRMQAAQSHVRPLLPIIVLINSFERRAAAFRYRPRQTFGSPPMAGGKSLACEVYGKSEACFVYGQIRNMFRISQKCVPSNLFKVIAWMIRINRPAVYIHGIAIPNCFDDLF